MSKEDVDVFIMRKVAKTWTSPRLYEILKDGKVVLKLRDEDDAKLVLDYLNKNKCKESGKKGSKTKKSTAKKSTSKKSTAKKSTKKSISKKK